MSGQRKKIESTKPWRREDAKARMREALHKLPSWKRMLVYCIGLPCAAYGGAAFFISMKALDENLPWGFWGQLAFGVAVCFLLFWALPILIAASPRAVVMREKVISICQGQSARHIQVYQVESIAFAGDESDWKMLVEVRRKKGGTSSVSVRLSPKVAEAEIVAFLFEKGLSHLYRAGKP